MSDLDELGKLGELNQDQTRTSAEFSKEEAYLLDELLASADITLPPSPAVRSDRHRTSTEVISQYIGTEISSKYIGTEMPSKYIGIGPSQDLVHEAPAFEEPVDAASVEPAEYGPPAPSAGESSDTTTAGEEKESAEPDPPARYRVSTEADSQLEHADQDDEPAPTKPGVALAEVDRGAQMTVTEVPPDEEEASPVSPARPPRAPASGSHGPRSAPPPTQIAPVPISLPEPMTYAGSRPRPGLRPVLVAVLVAILFLAALGAGFVALKQSKSTSQWRQSDLSEVARNSALVVRDRVLSKVLVSDHSAVSSQQSETSKLTGRVASLQAQLSALSKTEEKTLTKNVLARLDSAAGTVSGGIATCVDGTNSLQAEIDGDLQNPSHKDPRLQANTKAAEAACATARRDSLQLQAALRGAQ
jgi:hypothetical protein